MNLNDNEQIRHAKAVCRKKLIERQDLLSGSCLSESNKMIYEAVTGSPEYKNAVSLFTYLSVKNEPDTRAILRRALSDGKRVYVPKCISSHEMLAVRIYDDGHFVRGLYSIPEPEACTETASAAEIDLSIIPCVSVSPAGIRLGHGAGYYDRFLQNGGTKKLCVCYERMLFDDIPSDELDVRMDIVITEKRKIYCKD